MHRSAWSALLVLLASCGSSASSPSDGGTTSKDAGSKGPDAKMPGQDAATGKDATGLRDVGSSHDSSTGNDAGMPPAIGASVLQFHNHANRDGTFVDPAITLARARTFGTDSSFAGTFSGNVYASPLYVERGPQGKGAFYVVTESNGVFALDETTGAVVWQKSLGNAPSNTGAGCGNISPIGITGTPAIDLATRLIIFDAASADGQDNIATHTIYALSIDDGTEAWHVDASTITSPDGIAFTPQTQNQRGAVLILAGVAYVVYGGHYGDCGDYHGWVIAAPLSGAGATGWASTVKGAGIWGVGGAASDGESIFVTTGNGIDSNVTWAESEGIVRLAPGATFTKATTDYFAPYDWQSLDQGDVDLSGSGPLVIDAPSMTPPALVMAQGKDGTLYLVDRSNLGGIATSSAPANVGALHVHSGEITNGGAFATVSGTTYVVVRPNGTQGAVGCPGGTSGDLVAVKLDPGAPAKMSVAWCASSGGVGSPSITTSDGTQDPLVWTFGADPGGTGQLSAWNLTTGASVLAAGGSSVSGVRRFTTPVAVHGRIFVAGDGQLYAFKPQ